MELSSIQRKSVLPIFREQDSDETENTMNNIMVHDRSGSMFFDDVFQEEEDGFEDIKRMAGKKKKK